MEYTWLGKQAAIVIEEKDMCEYDVFVNVGDQNIKMAEMAKRSNGTYVAMSDGYLYDGATEEEAVRKAVDVKHKQAEDRVNAAQRVNENAAARKKRKQEEKERQAAFE